MCRQTNLSYIFKDWCDKKNITSKTVLFLFNKIGFESFIFKNGEYYILFSEWEEFYPLFNFIFTIENKQEFLKSIDKRKMLCFLLMLKKE